MNEDNKQLMIKLAGIFQNTYMKGDGNYNKYDWGNDGKFYPNSKEEVISRFEKCAFNYKGNTTYFKLLLKLLKQAEQEGLLTSTIPWPFYNCWKAGVVEKFLSGKYLQNKLDRLLND
jgi:hypothetical protein